MFYRLLLLFTIIPLVELFLLYLLNSVMGQLLGFWLGLFFTIFIVLATGFCGAFLAKLQGWFVWHQVRLQLARGKMPTDQLFDSVLLLVASVLLVTPGILTDIVGLGLLIPPLRMYVRTYLKAYLTNRMMLEVRTATFGPEGMVERTFSSFRGQQTGESTQPREADVIDVEYHRKDEQGERR